MTTLDPGHDDNIARLNAFLDQFPDGGLDPDFDDAADYLDREFVHVRLQLTDGGDRA